MPAEKLRLPTEYAQAEAEAAVRTPGNFARPELVVQWGSKRFEGRFKEGTVEHQSNGLLKLDCTLLGKFARRTKREKVKVWAMLSDHEVPLFTGEATFVQRKGHETELVAASDGRYLEKKSFDERVEYPGVTASDVVFDAASRGPYPSHRVKVDHISDPRMNFGQDAEVKLITAITEAEALADLVHYDHPDGGFVGVKKPDLLNPGEIHWSYNVQADLPRGGFEPVMEEEEESDYSSVMLYSRGENNQFHFGPIKFPIDWRDIPPPKVDIPLWVQLSEDDLERADDYAMRFGRELAARMGRGIYTIELITPFNPFILPMNTVFISEQDYYETEAFYREWAWVVDREIKHTLSGVRESHFTMSGVITYEEEIPVRQDDERVTYSGVRTRTTTDLSGLTWGDTDHTFSDVGDRTFAELS